MAKTTHCPNCFMDYQISTEQFNATQGRMRCGACRQEFHAVFLEDLDAPEIDPDSLSIEPLSEPDIALSESDFPDNLYMDSDIDNLLEGYADIQSDDLGPTNDLSDGVGQEKWNDTTGTSLLSNNDIVKSEEAPDQATNTDRMNDLIAAVANSEMSSPEQPELDLGQFENSTDSLFQTEDSTEQQTQQDQNLIDQVDDLVDELVSSEESAHSALEPSLDPSSPALEDELSDVIDESSEHEDQSEQAEQPELGAIFDSKRRDFGRTMAVWLGTPAMLLLCLGLIALLAYQLWLRQALPIAENQQLQPIIKATLAPIKDPLEAQLLERLNMELPVRRDLAGLQLISAVTEAHPSRASIILLRVSIVNRSEIAQPFPWLELSLTDENGRLVSRRALAPRDYLYNNETRNEIGPNELKRIAVELLAFPQQATGYELKLINK